MEFRPFPKIPRIANVFKEMTVTEKIDGTNACVVIESIDRTGPACLDVLHQWDDQDEIRWGMWAQSRKKIITPGKNTDNFSFAQWVKDHAEELVKLGHGYHYGEWWGKGIQRGYELDEKRFSLFNVNRPDEYLPECVSNVPVVYSGEFDPNYVEELLNGLIVHGSYAAPGYMNPEGLMVWVGGLRQYLKAPLDPKPKG